MKKTFKLVLKKNVEGNEWVVRVYINGKYDEGKTYYGDDNKEDAEASMLDMRSKLKKAGYEEEIKEGNNMKSTFKTIKEEVIEERKIIDGIKKGIRGVVDVLDAALVPRGIVGGKKCACGGEGWVNCECSKSNRKKKCDKCKSGKCKCKVEIKEGQGIYRYPEFNKLRLDIEHAQKTGNGKGVLDAKDALKKWAKEKGININNDPHLVDLLSDSLVIEVLNKCECKECKGKDCKNCECKDCECAGCEGRIQKEQMEEIKTLVDQILEEKKGSKKKKKGKKSKGVIGYGFGYNNDDMVGDCGDGGGISEGQGVISALEGIKSKIDALISESSDVDEPIEETVKLTQEGAKHIRKDCKTLKRAEGYQDMLYNIYDKVKLVKSPKYSEDGEYVWEVGAKFLTKVPDDPMSIRRQPRPNLEDYADE